MTRGFGGSSSSSAGGVTLKIKRHLEIDPRRLGEQMGPIMTKLVENRVARGLDTNDRPFRTYAALTRASGLVDLWQTGSMIRSLRWSASSNRGGVSVSVTVGAEHALKALALHFGTQNMEPRPWLGLSPKDFEKMSAMLAKRPALRAKPGPA